MSDKGHNQVIMNGKRSQFSVLNDVVNGKKGHNIVNDSFAHKPDGLHITFCNEDKFSLLFIYLKRRLICFSVTAVKDFQDHSYIEWDFKESFHRMLEERPYTTELQLMFRARNGNGLLFKVQNIQKSEYMILEVSVTNNSILFLMFDFTSECRVKVRSPLCLQVLFSF